MRRADMPAGAALWDGLAGFLRLPLHGLECRATLVASPFEELFCQSHCGPFHVVGFLKGHWRRPGLWRLGRLSRLAMKPFRWIRIVLRCSRIRTSRPVAIICI